MNKAALITGVASIALAGCVAPMPDSTPGQQFGQQFGMSAREANTIVYDVIADAGCSIHFDDFQAALDARGYDPALADPTTPEGRLILARRFILESAILDMAEAGLLERSSWKFTSNTGACA